MILPKSYIYTDRDLKAIGIVPGDKEDQVESTIKSIRSLLTRPAMWTGKKDDHDAIVTLLITFLKNLTTYCNSLDEVYFSESHKLGPTGLHSLTWDGKYPNKVRKSIDDSLQELNTYVDKFIAWVPENIILFKREIVVEELKENGKHCSTSLDKVFNHPQIITCRKDVKHILATHGMNSKHVFVELIWHGKYNFGIPHYIVVVLNRPVNQENMDAKRAVELGFVDE